jgi:hypothetical protein
MAKPAAATRMTALATKRFSVARPLVERRRRRCRFLTC